MLRWFTDFLLKCHVSDTEVYGQVGNVTLDHDYFGPAENMTEERPAFHITPDAPGSDLAGEMAACFAAASLVVRRSNASDARSYSSTLLTHAASLFTFADTYRGVYSKVIDTEDSYNSNSYADELVWAALWLYRATNATGYLAYAKDYWSTIPSLAQPVTVTFDWSEKTPGE